MQSPPRSAPKPRHNRVLLQFDYDCFYAQVVEKKKPPLKSGPLGIRQKNILATCNYHARRRGVRKLMLVSEAVTVCPDLVLVSGEDLTPFRDASKKLFHFFRSHSWNNKVERLGLDEVFMVDVTDMVDYNLSCLNTLSMADSFFCLSREDPEHGFSCDLTSIAGCVVGPPASGSQLQDHTYLRLLLASHLAQYLRLKVETDFGYTSTCGIATNKLLSKLVGGCNKPRNQTTLLALKEDVVYSFIDGYHLKQLPGLGTKMVHSLQSRMLSQDPEAQPGDSHLTVGHVRHHPSISPATLETLFGGAGAEKGVGLRVWRLLHGVDHTEVKEASDVPSQISIEDTYKGLETMAQISEQLHRLSCSLVRRLRSELVVCDETGAQRWIATPRTLRLSIRSWPTRPAAGGDGEENHGFSRVSRSGPLPAFIFDLDVDVGEVGQQLVTEALIPLLRRLQSGKRWNVQLLNICVVNMGDDKTGAGRDIGVMFRTQDEALRPWKAWEGSSTGEAAFESEEADMDSGWDSTQHPSCPRCGHLIPGFAMAAHARYHELEE
ncbi:hypothetical protein CDD80_6033 [Ophiocordyceps camponoti-rufipedis]|uniref:UmuC domain-containing protein n=1 Tax=Ophiocordyceps camponoti-rufipedis TaxID=2004952 RepID=A0A2C5ZAM1_9HYPO|nr:hypothetical protein CDD80_6033 [Ophiocordyceps camponoti-rufipedis]